MPCFVLLPACLPACLPAHPPACSAYSAQKIRENVQCEIMHVIVEEASDSYRCGRQAGAGWLGGGQGRWLSSHAKVAKVLLRLLPPLLLALSSPLPSPLAPRQLAPTHTQQPGLPAQPRAAAEFPLEPTTAVHNFSSRPD